MTASASTAPRVALVLVNWNSGPLTSQCLRSIMAGEVRPTRTLVYDNGSADGSPDRIAAEFPEAELVRSPTNVGFAAACNHGIRWALSGDFDMVWLLNNDTIVAPGCLRALTETLEAMPAVGVVTGKILRMEPPGVIWYAGGEMDWRRCQPLHHGSGEQDGERFSREGDTLFVSGCCMLVRSAAFSRVGLFDAGLFAYFEDADWCLRAGALGIRMRYQPRGVLWHKDHGSLHRNKPANTPGNITPVYAYYHTRNHLLIIRRYTRGLARIRPFLLVARQSLAAGLRWLLLLRTAKLACLLAAWHDGFADTPRWAHLCLPKAAPEA